MNLKAYERAGEDKSRSEHGKDRRANVNDRMQCLVLVPRPYKTQSHSNLCRVGEGNRVSKPFECAGEHVNGERG